MSLLIVLYIIQLIVILFILSLQPSECEIDHVYKTKKAVILSLIPFIWIYLLFKRVLNIFKQLK